MGMNNWGGVTEHMTKKARIPFGGKRRARKFKDDKNAFLIIDEKKPNKLRNNKMLKEIIFLVSVIAITLFLLYLWIF